MLHKLPAEPSLIPSLIRSAVSSVMGKGSGRRTLRFGSEISIIDLKGCRVTTYGTCLPYILKVCLR